MYLTTKTHAFITIEILIFTMNNNHLTLNLVIVQNPVSSDFNRCFPRPGVLWKLHPTQYLGNNNILSIF